MRAHRSLALLAFLATLPAAAQTRDAAPPPRCAVPQTLLDDEIRLPELAQHFRDKHPITIVVIGGASTAGTAAADPEHDAYPRKLENLLRQHHPGMEITVVNRGVARQTTQEMVARFPRDVFAASPTLVVWETGTYDAVRNVDVEIFAEGLETGLAELREHRIEVILINMQYNPRTTPVINYAPYLDALQQRADVDGIYVFRRYEMMKAWSDNGVFDLVDVPQERRATLATQVYDCLAQRLTDTIERAAAQ